MNVHCDDLIDDPTVPQCVRDFLDFNRRPAIHTIGKKSPKLFATLRHNAEGRKYLGHWTAEEPAMAPVYLRAGQPVRVVMASCFGDVGITPDLTAECGYVLRLPLDKLDNFSAEAQK